MSLCILGRQPKLGLAELESIYGADKIQLVGDQAALVDGVINHARLGGTIKVAKFLTEINSTNWQELTDYTKKELPKHVCCLIEGKLKLGISVYGLDVNLKQLLRSGLEFKKVSKSTGRSTRIVPNTNLALNSAQILHNQLTGSLGMELLYIKNGSKTILAQTTSVQDVDDYSRRDFGRPKRDSFVGMLPPKLAQIMINLAVSGQREAVSLLDPFCGTGVVLQEAILMGYKVQGSDLNPKMIDYSKSNLDWLSQNYTLTANRYALSLADATSYKWTGPIDHIVSEIYLGSPLSGLPSPEKLSEIVQNCDIITKKFLKNVHNQLKPGTLHCIAVPTWRVGNKFKHLNLLDHLNNLGYNRIELKHASWSDLIYHREGQIVARELLILQVK